MKITGRVLNVKDGDAIILHVSDDDKKLLVVIDGGDTTYKQKILSEVKKSCNELKKEAPDLVVLTHYDSDHIAGIISIVEEYKNKIKKVWVHNPAKVLREAIDIVVDIKKYQNREITILKEIDSFKLHQQYLVSQDREEFSLILESISQLNRLMALIRDYKIPHDEPFAGECKLEGWPKIKVIGPTREYYNSIFSSLNINELFSEEVSKLILERTKPISSNIQSNPCDLLKTTSQITPTNKASAIIRFDCEDGKYLFTGDAGIESLKKTEGYNDSIMKMKFFKIPHHGSNNNISKELIEIIDPDIAYCSGDKYEDKEVIECLKRKSGRIVKTTRENGDLTF